MKPSIKLMVTLTIIFVFFLSSSIYNHYYSVSPTFINPSSNGGSDACTNKNKQGDPNSSIVRILVVDGGGIDGIIPLTVLNYMEQKSGKPVSQLFDFFIGTSTGAIIVTTLNISENNKPKFTAFEVLERYKTLSKIVMSASFVRRIFTLNGMLAPKFSTETLYNELKLSTGGNIPFGALLNKVVITSYNLTKKQIELFRNWECPVADHPLPDLLTAATAAPMFYSPVILKNVQKKVTETFADGAIFSNVPFLYGMNEALRLYPHANKIIIVHLGTGGVVLNQLQLAGDKTQSWGVLEWAPALMSIIYKSQNTEVNEAINLLKQISIKNNLDYTYYYFNKKYPFSGPFDPSDRNIRKIIMTADEILTEFKPQLDFVVKRLVSRE